MIFKNLKMWGILPFSYGRDSPTTAPHQESSARDKNPNQNLKNNMKLIKKTLAGIASLLLLGQGLHAATVSYSNTKAFDSNYSTLTLSQFNTSLGTLTGVTIEINYSTLQGSFTVTNNYPSDVLVSGYTSAVSIKQVGSLGGGIFYSVKLLKLCRAG